MIVPASRWRATLRLPMRIDPHEIDASTRNLHLYQAYGMALALCHADRACLGRPDRVVDRAPVGQRLDAVGLDAAVARDVLHRFGLGCRGGGADLVGVCVSAATLPRVRRTLC